MTKIKWNSKLEDLELANDILAKYFEDGSEKLGTQEVSFVPDGGVEVARSDWVIEIEETFEHLYGEIRGGEISKQVLTTLITRGHQVH